MARIHVTQCLAHFIPSDCYCSNGHSQVQLVVIICIDPPLAPHLNLPQITIQHWKSVIPDQVPRAGSLARQKVGQMVWQADWTHGVTPNYYVPLADIFLPGAIPAIYGATTQAFFDAVDLTLWRQEVINNWS